MRKRFSTWAWASAICLALCAIGCSDDDSGAQCGNGVMEGSEECDGDDLGTQTCTNIPGNFTGGTLGCSDYCMLDTSQCTSADLCGNGVIDTGETCDSTNLNGQSCTSIPGGYVGGTLSCTGQCAFDTTNCIPDPCGNGDIDTDEDCDGTNLNSQDCTTIPGGFTGGDLACTTSCEFDTTNCEISPDCGNNEIDGNEECDGTNLNNQDCTTITGNYVGGVLDCTGGCTFDESGCIGGSAASAQIQAARGTGDGTGLALPIEGVYVTYLTAPTPAGFVVQAEPTGPALFIYVDPATLNPPPQVGDTISFTITEMGTYGTMRQAEAIIDYTNLATGFDVTTLYQNVSTATDLVSNLDGYESEVISGSATVVTDFSFAGTGFLSAQIETAGITANPDLLVRLPDTTIASLELVNGCVFDFTGVPMWRYNTDAQIGIWYPGDVSVTSCPAPTLTGAVATSATSVVLTFSRSILPSSITDAATQFTFDNGLTASAAVVNGTTVTLTTSTQTPLQTYEVTVAVSVTDTVGTGVDQNANTATFTGFSTPAIVMINELNANIDDGCDLIELRVISGGSMDGYRLRERVTYVLTFTGLIVDTNDYIIVHFDGNDADCNPGASGNETAAKDELPNSTYSANYDNAWDWYSTDTGLTNTDNVFTLYDNLDVIMDAVFVTQDATGDAAGATETQAANVAAAGEWTMVGGGIPTGGFVDYLFRMHAVLDLDGTGTDPSGESIQRNSNIDTNTMDDWTQGASSWGLNNAGQTDF